MTKDQETSNAIKRAEILVLFNSGKTYYEIVHSYNYSKYMTKMVKDQYFPNTVIIPDMVFKKNGLFNWDLVKNNDIFGIGQFVN